MAPDISCFMCSAEDLWCESAVDDDDTEEEMGCNVWASFFEHEADEVHVTEEDPSIDAGSPQSKHHYSKSPKHRHHPRAHGHHPSPRSHHQNHHTHHAHHHSRSPRKHHKTASDAGQHADEQEVSTEKEDTRANKSLEKKVSTANTSLEKQVSSMDENTKFLEARQQWATQHFGRSDPVLLRSAELMPPQTPNEAEMLQECLERFKDRRGPDALTLFTDARGRSLLWHAVELGSEQTVVILIKAGAKPLRSNLEEDDPVALAVSKGNERVACMLTANAMNLVKSDSWRIKVTNNPSYGLMRDGEYKVLLPHEVASLRSRTNRFKEFFVHGILGRRKKRRLHVDDLSSRLDAAT